MCLSSVMFCSINLCKYFREVMGVSVGVFCAWHNHCVSNDVGRRGNFSSVLLRWVLLVILRRNSVLVIGDLRQLCWVMRGILSEPSGLASICVIKPL